MLTVLVETRNHEEALARTLASLVSAAVEGMVREVIVLDRGSTDGTRTVADHSGCLFVSEGELSDAMHRARGEWLLLIEPGARLLEGWTEEVRRHAGSAGTPARFKGSSSRFAWSALLRRPGLREGLVLPRKEAVQLAGGSKTSGEVARQVRAKRIEAGIIPAQQGPNKA
jgi:hypothetical protein